MIVTELYIDEDGGNALGIPFESFLSFFCLASFVQSPSIFNWKSDRKSKVSLYFLDSRDFKCPMHNQFQLFFTQNLNLCS